MSSETTRLPGGLEKPAQERLDVSLAARLPSGLNARRQFSLFVLTRASKRSCDRCHKFRPSFTCDRGDGNPASPVLEPTKGMDPSSGIVRSRAGDWWLPPRERRGVTRGTARIGQRESDWKKSLGEILPGVAWSNRPVVFRNCYGLRDRFKPERSFYKGG